MPMPPKRKRPYVFRFASKVIGEIAKLMTTQQVVTGVVLALLAFLYQYVNGKLTLAALRENTASVLYPFVWLVCGFGCYCVIKAAIDLHQGNVSEVNNYQPAVPGFKPKSPSPLSGIVAAAVSICLLALLSWLTFRASFVPAKKSLSQVIQNPAPTQPKTLVIPAPPKAEANLSPDPHATPVTKNCRYWSLAPCWASP